MDDDDVIDYMVMEAVAAKAAEEMKKAQKEQEKKEWKKDKAGIDRLKELAG